MQIPPPPHVWVSVCVCALDVQRVIEIWLIWNDSYTFGNGIEFRNSFKLYLVENFLNWSWWHCSNSGFIVE